MSISNIDKHTGARTKKALESDFEDWLADSYSELSIIRINLDNFKHFNMHNGRAQGDVVLNLFIALLERDLNENCSIYRIEGDDFLISLKETAKLDAIVIAENILTTMREKLRPPQKRHCGKTECIGPAKLSVSIGIAEFDIKKLASIEKLFNVVNEKLAVAKSTGKDRIVA